MGTNRFPEGVCGVHSRRQSDKQAQRGVVSETVTYSEFGLHLPVCIVCAESMRGQKMKLEDTWIYMKSLI